MKLVTSILLGLFKLLCVISVGVIEAVLSSSGEESQKDSLSSFIDESNAAFDNYSYKHKHGYYD